MCLRDMGSARFFVYLLRFNSSSNLIRPQNESAAMTFRLHLLLEIEHGWRVRKSACLLYVCAIHEEIITSSPNRSMGLQRFMWSDQCQPSLERWLSKPTEHRARDIMSSQRADYYTTTIRRLSKRHTNDSSICILCTRKLKSEGACAQAYVSKHRPGTSSSLDKV